MKRMWLAGVAVLALTLPLTACRPHTVRLGFRPTVGAVYRYEVTVRSVTETDYEGAELQRHEEETVLVARHEVMTADEDGVDVEVLLSEEGSPTLAFVVRFDASGRLESVQLAPGGPSSASGSLGLSEIFPAAAGPPPERRLEPGDTWELDADIEVPGASRSARLQGSGRLERLDVEDGLDLAFVRSDSSLPLLVRSSAPDGTVVLDGRQQVRQSAVYDLSDGSLRSARSTSTGTFRVRLSPAAATGSVAGTLEARVESTTRRLT